MKELNKEAILNLSQTQIKEMMKSIEQKITTKIELSEKTQAQYQQFNIHFLLMKFIKVMLSKIIYDCNDRISSILSKIDISNYDVFKEIGIDIN